MSESFDEIMDYAAVVVADCDIPLLDRLKMAHDHELERRMREQYARGYEDGRRSMDAKHYAVALKLQDLTFDGSSHDNLSKIAYAVYPCATGWTCESSKGLRDELVRLMGGVGKPSGGFAKSADFGKSESVGNDEVGKGCQIHQTVTTYDVLDNERHKAIAELRRISIDALCDKYDYVEVYPEFMWAVGQAIGLRHGAGFEDVVSRLTHLLGGDECNFSGAESYMDATSEKSNPAETSDASTNHVTLVTPLTENETCPNDDETCPNPVQSMSITDELDNERRKAIAELRKVCTELDESVWTWIEDVAIAIGAQDGPNDEYESMLPKITCRLIHLLGGDEPTVMEYIQRIVREHDRRCLDVKLSGAELSQASVDAMSRRADQSHESSPMRQENETGITDELRKFKGHINAGLTPEMVLVLRAEINCIADRIDAQVVRMCER